MELAVIKIDKIATKIMSLAFTILLLPSFIISFFDNPSADDFCYSGISKNMGFLKAQFHWYGSWSGRYFSTAEMSFNPLTFGWVAGYKIIPIVLLILTFFAIYLLIREFFKQEIHRVYRIFITLLILSLYIYIAPSSVQAFYWMAGSLTYQVSLIFSLFLIIIIKRLIKEFKLKYLILGIICTFIIVGCSETIMFVLVILLGLINLYFSYKIKKINKPLSILLLSTIIFSIIVIICPGNFIRSANIHIGLFPSLSHSFIESIKFIINWGYLIPGFLLSLASIPFITNLIKNEKSILNIMYINPLLSMLVTFILIFATFFPSYFSVGIIPPERTLNITYTILIIGWVISLINFIILLNRFPLKNIIKKYLVYLLSIILSLLSIKIFYNIGSFPNSQDLFILMFIILCIIFLFNNISYFVLYKSIIINNYTKVLSIVIIAIFFSYLGFGRNFKRTASDLVSGRAKAFDIELNNRYNKIQACKDNNEDICIVKPLKNIPLSIYATDITNDQHIWINTCTADYFNIKSIKLENI